MIRITIYFRVFLYNRHNNTYTSENYEIYFSCGRIIGLSTLEINSLNCEDGGSEVGPEVYFHADR